MSDLPVFSGLDRAKLDYLAGGMELVQGWLRPASALYLAGLETAQRGQVEGGIAEIGVHCGKLFLALSIGVPATDECRALDIWDHQQINEHGEPEKVRSIFERHLATHDQTDRVELVQLSSLDLREHGFVEPGRVYRMFSVDGGHDSDLVVNDIRLAEETLAPGGVVAVDDIFRKHFLGVLTGYVEYKKQGGSLVPYALIPNKMLLTDPDHRDANKQQMRDLFEAGMSKPDVEFFGTTIDVYENVPWQLEATDGTSAPLWQPDGSDEALAAALRAKTLDQDATHRKLHETIAILQETRAALASERRRSAQRKRDLARVRTQLSTVRARPLRVVVAERVAPKVPRAVYRPLRALYRLIKR